MVWDKTNLTSFFKNYYGYLLTFIGIGVLTVGVSYHVYVNRNGYRKTLDKPKKESKRVRYQKDPVVDNVYWSIASLAIYYLVYLGLRYLGSKDQAVWVIVLSIFLSKIGLAMFSSCYYQKNDFDQNLERSFHPGYFIHQNMEQIILSLIGYFGLAALIYFDRQKESGQQPGIEPQPNNNDNIQETLAFFQKIAGSFPHVIQYYSEQEPFQALNDQGLFRFEHFKNQIETAIKSGQITKLGVLNLIDNVFETPNDGDYFNHGWYQKPFLNCFFSCLVNNNNQASHKKMTENFLTGLINQPTDEKIASLKTLMNELFYFINGVKHLQLKLFKKIIFLIDKSDFATTQAVSREHLNSLRRLINNNGFAHFFREQNKIPVNKCQKIVTFYHFLTTQKNQIKITAANFCRAFSNS